jgi:UMF1 family MFS transporter
MEGGGSVGLGAPRYVEEDTTETSEREIRGWYCYGLAAEVFAVCGVGEFRYMWISSTQTKSNMQARFSQ